MRRGWGSIAAVCAVVSGAAGISTASAAAAAQKPPPLSVYVSLPLGGSQKSSTSRVLRGARLALAEAGGRAGGRPVRLVSLNYSTKKEPVGAEPVVAANARRATKDPSAIAYIGDYNSFACRVSIPITNRGGLLQVSPTATFAGLTRPGVARGQPARFYPTGRRTFGRIMPADHVQGPALAAYAVTNGARRVMIVRDDIPGYSSYLARGVRAAVKARGAAVVGDTRLRSKGRNASSIAANMRSRRADALVYLGVSDSGAPPLFRAVHRRLPSARLYGSDGVFDARFTRAIGSAIRKTFVTVADRAAEGQSDAGRDVLARYRARYGGRVGGDTVFADAVSGYEAMSVTLDAISRAGPRSGERAAVVDAFFATRDRQSVLGNYSIDPLGDTTLPLFGGYRFVRGRPVYDRTIDVTVS